MKKITILILIGILLVGSVIAGITINSKPQLTPDEISEWKSKDLPTNYNIIEEIEMEGELTFIVEFSDGTKMCFGYLDDKKIEDDLEFRTAYETELRKKLAGQNTGTWQGCPYKESLE